MRRRGFTLIEVGMVCVLLSLSFVVLGTMAIQGYQRYQVFMQQVALKADCQRAAEGIFRLVAGHSGYQIDGDNHGMRVGDRQVRWTGQKLELRQGKRVTLLLEGEPLDFSATRRDGVLTLNFALARHAGRRTILLHEIYDYPRVGLP